mmetsp:Transcript_8351/g.14432  ORF Transcript_8351/g.14432 Transcript_8351/m.14432 type:complete len:211 (-) Transcript_8351:144-776(-)
MSKVVANRHNAMSWRAARVASTRPIALPRTHSATRPKRRPSVCTSTRRRCWRSSAASISTRPCRWCGAPKHSRRAPTTTCWRAPPQDVCTAVCRRSRRRSDARWSRQTSRARARAPCKRCSPTLRCRRTKSRRTPCRARRVGSSASISASRSSSASGSAATNSRRHRTRTAPRTPTSKCCTASLRTLCTPMPTRTRWRRARRTRRAPCSR